MQNDLKLKWPPVIVGKHLDVGGKRYTTILGIFKSEGEAISFAIDTENDQRIEDERHNYTNGITEIWIASTWSGSVDIPRWGNIGEYMEGRRQRQLAGW